MTVGFGFCCQRAISLLLLEGFALINAITISITEESVLMVLVQLVNALLVFMAFMAHVITKTCVVMNEGAFDDGNDGIFFVVGGDIDGVARLITAHSSPFLTLASHEL